VTPDPLASLADAFASAARQLRHASDLSRESWDDEGRRLFESRYGTRIAHETAAAMRAVEEARQILRRAVAEL
jgi:hypothetical protein